MKCFNKRVKGTDQFWSREGVEAIMALRALWMSQDQRWDRYWTNRPAYTQKLAAENVMRPLQISKHIQKFFLLFSR